MFLVLIFCVLVVIIRCVIQKTGWNQLGGDYRLSRHVKYSTQDVHNEWNATWDFNPTGTDFFIPNLESNEILILCYFSPNSSYFSNMISSVSFETGEVTSRTPMPDNRATFDGTQVTTKDGYYVLQMYDKDNSGCSIFGTDVKTGEKVFSFSVEGEVCSTTNAVFESSMKEILLFNTGHDATQHIYGIDISDMKNPKQLWKKDVYIYGSRMLNAQVPFLITPNNQLYLMTYTHGLFKKSYGELLRVDPLTGSTLATSEKLEKGYRKFFKPIYSSKHNLVLMHEEIEVTTYAFDPNTLELKYKVTIETPLTCSIPTLDLSENTLIYYCTQSLNPTDFFFVDVATGKITKSMQIANFTCENGVASTNKDDRFYVFCGDHENLGGASYYVVFDGNQVVEKRFAGNSVIGESLLIDSTDCVYTNIMGKFNSLGMKKMCFDF